MRKALLLAALPLIACAPIQTPPAVPGLERSTLDGVFTAAQATRGAAIFAANCARCHGGDLKGKDDAPNLVDGATLKEFSGDKLGALYVLISSEMPFDKPASLAPASYADVTAFLLAKNGLPAGKQDLPTDKAALDGIVTKAP